MLQRQAQKFTSLEGFSSWIAATWALVLFHPHSYFSKYPQLFSDMPSFIGEYTIAFLLAGYFIFTLVILETHHWWIVSLIHFTTYLLIASFFLYQDSTGQVGYAYAVLAIFNLIRWISNLHERQT